MKKPLVSVLIPVYNVENYLAQCLDSVLIQTYSNIEIICCNDCSTDSSLNILKRYQQKDNRISIINNEKNKGLFDTRIELLKKTQGDYIYNLDSDDWLSPVTLETMLSATNDNSIDVVKAHLTQVFPDKLGKRTLQLVGTQESTLYGSDVLTYIKKAGKDLQIVHTLINSKYLTPWINKAQKYAGTHILMAEDQIFTLLLTHLVKSYTVINKHNLYFYRRTPYSSVGLMSKTPRLMINHAKSLLIIQEILGDSQDWVLLNHHKQILINDIKNYGYKNFSSTDLNTLAPALESLQIKGY